MFFTCNWDQLNIYKIIIAENRIKDGLGNLNMNTKVP